MCDYLVWIYTVLLIQLSVKFFTSDDPLCRVKNLRAVSQRQVSESVLHPRSQNSAVCVKHTVTYPGCA
jgi:hypothetical protein